MDEAGGIVTSGTIPHAPKGFAHLVRTIRARAVEPADVCVALETRQGPLVGALLDEGFTIYAINPKAVDRHRERFRVAGAKSDLRDAWVLATLLRTDRQLYRAIQPDSELAQELRVLTRDRVALVQTRTMVSNQLTAALKAYFPEFLDLFGDPDRPVALAVFQAFPTWEALSRARPQRLAALLRQHHQPRSETKAREIHQRLRRPAFRIAPVIARTKSRLALALARQLDTLAEQIAA
jgi:transposase